ncbi:MAG: TolC family protein [Mariprofundaceae bacterium]
MKNNSVVNIAIFVWSLVIPLSAQATLATPGVITEKAAVAEALANNPRIAGMQSKAEAMHHIPSQAGSLPDPVLSLNALNLPTDSFSTTQENMTQLQVGISQAIPFPGKLGLKAEAASFEANAADSSAGETNLRAVRDTRLSWWNLFYLDRAIATLHRNQGLLRQFVKIAESKYRTGQGLQADVLMAQVELSKLLDAEITLNAARKNQAAQFNALLNRPATTEVTLPGQVNETLPPTPDAASLHRQSRAVRPLLHAQKSRVNAAHSRRDLAEKGYYPDFTLSGAYGSRNGINPVNGQNRSDFASIKLSMTIPLYAGSKQSKAIQQQKAEVAKEQFYFDDLNRDVDAEIERALADYQAAYNRASLFKTGIIPQASQSVASMLSAYQVNKVDLLNLINAQVTLFNYETQYWKALSSGKQAWARLEAAVGENISEDIRETNGMEANHE